jgi:uncharacterized protein YkwD
MPAKGALGAIAAIFAAACFVPAIALPAPARAGAAHNTMAALDQGVLQQLNQIREQHGLVPLKLDPSLNAAASQHSREMAADGYFEHSSHDGTAFWRRIQHYFGSRGYGYWSVGENLLWSSPDVDAVHALQLWMHSPEHRANILAARWREIGVAAVHVASAPGTYDNLPVTIITTEFGVRR